MKLPPVQVRCQHCHARLFDTTGRPVRQQAGGVEVHIRCWRCRRIVVVTIAAAAPEEPDSVLQ